MIDFSHVTKRYPSRHGAVEVLSDVSFRIERGDKIGLLGYNGAGKSTLLRLIGGVERPTSGAITRDMSVSWPLAFSGAFQISLTGLDNLKFICRVYGIEPESKVAFIEDFAELGKFLREPVRTYSAGMRARLAFAISMAIDFDCYLIDEILAVGDSRFQAKCKLELFEKRGDRTMIIASHLPDVIKQHCHSAFVLSDKQAVRCHDLDEAYARYTGAIAAAAT
jgi:capsular polysaccharide transport system ATP-binding protein